MKDKKKDNEPKAQVVGDIAAIISVISITPLVFTAIKNWDTSQLPYIWIALGLVTEVLWLYYGIQNKIQPDVLSGIIFLGVYIFLFAFKIILER